MMNQTKTQPRKRKSGYYSKQLKKRENSDGSRSIVLTFGKSKQKNLSAPCMHPQVFFFLIFSSFIKNSRNCIIFSYLILLQMILLWEQLLTLTWCEPKLKITKSYFLQIFPSYRKKGKQKRLHKKKKSRASSDIFSFIFYFF